MDNQLTEQNEKNTCKMCFHNNRIGDFFCHFCGHLLVYKHDTRSLRNRPLVDILVNKDSKKASLKMTQPLLLHIIDQDTTITVQPKPAIQIGRSMSSDASSIDVDLLPFDGFDKGVSHLHAVVLRDDESVFLIDQGSKNGTFLNGVPLKPYDSYLLYHGDVVYLGSLSIRLNFSI